MGINYLIDGEATVTLTLASGTWSVEPPVGTIITGDIAGSTLHVVSTTTTTATGWASGLFYDTETIDYESETLGGSLGADITTNGTFASDVSWTKGAGWTIAAGVASATASSSSLTQNTGATDQAWYKITFTISVWSAGSVKPSLGFSLGTNETSDGTYTQYLQAIVSNSLGFVASGPASLDISYVTCELLVAHGGSYQPAGTWETAYQGPPGFQFALDGIGTNSDENLYVRNNFDMEAYGQSIDIDGCAGNGTDRNTVDIIGVDATGTGSDPGNLLPWRSRVVFDGNGTLADHIWYMGGSAEHIRVRGIELTGTDKAGTAALYVNMTVAHRYGFSFINCKFADAFMPVYAPSTTHSMRSVSFLYCDFEFVDGDGTQGWLGYFIYSTPFKCCTFIATGSSGGSDWYLINPSSYGGTYMDCIFDGADLWDYAIKRTATNSSIFNCLFRKFQSGAAFCNSATGRSVWVNNVVNMTDITKSAIKLEDGFHVSDRNVSNTDGTNDPSLSDLETAFFEAAKNIDGEVVTINADNELSSPRAVLEDGSPDVYGNPTMRGPAQVDPRQKQGLV